MDDLTFAENRKVTEKGSSVFCFDSKVLCAILCGRENSDVCGIIMYATCKSKGMSWYGVYDGVFVDVAWPFRDMF